MIHRGISVSLQKLLPKYVPKTEAEVNDLLDCELRVQVHSSYFTYFAYSTYLKCFFLACQVKTGRRDPKGGPFAWQKLPSILLFPSNSPAPRRLMN